jgi:threonine dehydratase
VVELPTVADAFEAAGALDGLVVRTPVLRSVRLDAELGAPLVAKAESLQYTGSFKLRGAINRIRTFTSEQREAGLVTVSAGNAALAAAYAARLFDTEVTVVMPENAVAEKLAAVRLYGGSVVTEGVTSSNIAFERAHELQAEKGLTFVHPYDDPMVVAGAATATLELLEAEPEVRRLYVPCSGGGLLAGAILAVQATGGTVEVIGVQPTGADAFARSLAAGAPLAAGSIDTVADGLTSPRPGDVNFEIVRRAGSQVLVVDDDAILAAMGTLIRCLRIVIEPSAAAGLAGLLEHRRTAEHEAVAGKQAILVTGSNVNAQLLSNVVGKGMQP